MSMTSQKTFSSQNNNQARITSDFIEAETETASSTVKTRKNAGYPREPMVVGSSPFVPRFEILSFD